VRSGDNTLSLEHQIRAQQQTDASGNCEGSQQADDSSSSEVAGTACHPDSTLDADMWVKAAEFVPGQLWQSVGK